MHPKTTVSVYFFRFRNLSVSSLLNHKSAKSSGSFGKIVASSAIEVLKAPWSSTTLNNDPTDFGGVSKITFTKKVNRFGGSGAGVPEGF